MSTPRTLIVNEPLLKVGCTLGEAPLYDPKTQVLHFVDICENKVFHLDIRTLVLSVETFDEPITCLALRHHDNGLACTTGSGFAVLDGGSRLRYLCKPLPDHHAPYVRFNDGACDSKGRFFAGSIHSEDHGIPGQLWMYDPDTSECKVVDKGPFTVSNGLGWSPDGKTMYLTDSYTNLIYAYDFDDGKLSNRRVFVDAVAQGLPKKTYCDGLCIDEEGYVWSARWGGSRIVRFSPQGHIDTEIHFPTALNVTACCFGGPNEDQLYVTTAHCGAVGGDSSLQEKYPDSGHLFAVDLSGSVKGSQWRYRVRRGWQPDLAGKPLTTIAHGSLGETVMGSHELHLTYFTIRARGEPVLLLLVDSGVPFTLEEVSPETWVQWRTSGKVTRDLYPYAALPVLRVTDRSAGENDFVLAETSAILAFLEEFLAPKGTLLLNDMSLEVRVSAQMIKEASLFFLGRLLEASINEDWLAPSKREKLWWGPVTRYLRNTDGALLNLNRSIGVVPGAAESLKGYTATVVTAINFITDLFPSAKVELEGGGQYELCGKVWAAVNERERIVEYWTRNRVQDRPWTIFIQGTAEWIAQAAKL